MRVRGGTFGTAPLLRGRAGAETKRAVAQSCSVSSSGRYRKVAALFRVDAGARTKRYANSRMREQGDESQQLRRLAGSGAQSTERLAI